MRHRVFIGLTEVAGYLEGLRGGFEDLGIPTLYFDGAAHPFGYARSDVLGLVGRLVVRVRDQRAAGHGAIGRVFWATIDILTRSVRAALKLGILARAIVTCDAFIFAGGETFFRRRELPILRAIGKRVIVVFLGSDHRPPYLNGKWVRAMNERDTRLLLDDIHVIVERVRMAERFADIIIASGASAQFHVRPFAQFMTVGIPVAVTPATTGEESPPFFNGPGVRILHAPSDPTSKGTDLIRAAVSGVRSQGYQIDYVELVGRAHSEVLRCLRECDLVVDEAYSDAPMAVFSTEAAYFGKPSLVAGYYADFAQRESPPERIPPSLFCPPDRIEESLTRLVSDAAFREDLGHRAQVFVRTMWAPAEVARRYIRIIEHDTPDGWMVDPRTCDYLQGWGMSDGVRRDGLRRLVAQAGPAALCLAQRPDLEHLLLEAAT